MLILWRIRGRCTFPVFLCLDCFFWCKINERVRFFGLIIKNKVRNCVFFEKSAKIARSVEITERKITFAAYNLTIGHEQFQSQLWPKSVQICDRKVENRRCWISNFHSEAIFSQNFDISVNKVPLLAPKVQVLSMTATKAKLAQKWLFGSKIS